MVQKKEHLTLNQIIKFQKIFWAEKKNPIEVITGPLLVMQLMDNIADMDGGPEFLIAYNAFMGWCKKNYEWVEEKNGRTE